MYGIRVTYPQQSPPQRTMVRIRAAHNLLGFFFGLVLCYAVAAGLLLMLGRLALVSDPPAWGALVLGFLLYLAIGLFPLFWLGQMIDQARIAILDEPYLNREAGIIELKGTRIARLDDVASIEMETSSTGDGEMHYLFIILRNGESLRSTSLQMPRRPPAWAKRLPSTAFGADRLPGFDATEHLCYDLVNDRQDRSRPAQPPLGLFCAPIPFGAQKSIPLKTINGTGKIDHKRALIVSSHRK
jgi:hypothetical protein